jgi:hypothetical protein
MKFTWEDLASIENTVEKLYTVVYLISQRKSEHQTNMKSLCFIVSKLRHAAQLIDSNDLENKEAGFEMIKELFFTNLSEKIK